MKKLNEYTLTEIHTVCHGMAISKDEQFKIVTLEVAQRSRHWSQNKITVGFNENECSGYQDHIDNYGEDSGRIGLKGTKACEEKLHQHFYRLLTIQKSRLDLIMD